MFEFEDEENLDEQDIDYLHISYDTLSKLKYIFIVISIIVDIFLFVFFGTNFFDLSLLGFSVLFAFGGLFVGICLNIILLVIWLALKNVAIRTEQDEIAKEVTFKLNDITSLNIDEIEEYTVYINDNDYEFYKKITGNFEDEDNSNYEEIKDFNVRLYINKNIMKFVISPNNDIDILRQVNLDKIEIFSLNFDQIKYFIREGDKQVVSNVHGNDLSVGGAILGGFLAGTAGAVLGGRGKIQTDFVSIDERKCMLYYSKDDFIKCLIIDYDAYLMFQKIIPEKNPANAMALETNKQTMGLAEEIEKFHNLYINGIITEQEFLLKKQELLNKYNN